MNDRNIYLACGAASISIDENGQMTTSVDAFVNGVRRLLARRGRAASAKRVAARAHS